MNIQNIVFLVAGGDGGFGNLIFIGLMVIVFYFFMIRPQMKKAKETKKFRATLKKGDNIITIGGVHGKIVEMNEAQAIIETEGRTKIKIERVAISPEFTQGTGTSELAQQKKK